VVDARVWTMAVVGQLQQYTRSVLVEDFWLKRSNVAFIDKQSLPVLESLYTRLSLAVCCGICDPYLIPRRQERERLAILIRDQTNDKTDNNEFFQFPRWPEEGYLGDFGRDAVSAFESWWSLQSSFDNARIRSYKSMAVRFRTTAEETFSNGKLLARLMFDAESGSKGWRGAAAGFHLHAQLSLATMKLLRSELFLGPQARAALTLACRDIIDPTIGRVTAECLWNLNRDADIPQDVLLALTDLRVMFPAEDAPAFQDAGLKSFFSQSSAELSHGLAR
jgi:hypothetical protein